VTGKKTKIFDPADGFAPFADVGELTDATIARRDDRWWMFMAGEASGNEGIQLFSASLPAGAPLSPTGWKLTAKKGNSQRIAPLATHELSAAWDLKGGRHCPSYVMGWDPDCKAWVERIYYAGAAERPWGPYAIGYLEWDGSRWIERREPVFTATEAWEHGSVYEPNLIYADGKWKMWYVAGSNLEDYVVHGYAESDDGRNWGGHTIFVSAEQKVFDFCVIRTRGVYEAVFSRVWLAKAPVPAETGLWWCRCDRPSANLSDWSKPVQIMDAANQGWHAGPWKPCLRYDEAHSGKMFVFFDGGYTKDEPGPFPFAFTLGCLEIERPE
jgi:hypothetical protein